MVYDEPEKSFIHKWLLLTDPEDPSSGAKVTPQPTNTPPHRSLSSPTSSFYPGPPLYLLPLLLLFLSLFSIFLVLFILSRPFLPSSLLICPIPPLSLIPPSLPPSLSPPLSPLSPPPLPLSLPLLYLTQGYLKISINVIGPGDDPKPSPSSLTQESVDIES